MLENEEIIDQFKKSLSATIKSIGKSETLEVNFVQDGPSIEGDIINLIEPNLQSIRKNLNSASGKTTVPISLPSRITSNPSAIFR